MNAIKALALLILLVMAHKAAAGALVARYQSGAVILQTYPGACPPTYAEAWVTIAPDTRKAGCWGLDGRWVWIFVPGQKPISLLTSDFEVLK